MDITIIIDFLSYEWIRNMALTVFVMTCYFFIGFKIKDKHLAMFMKVSSFLVLLMTLSNHILLISLDSWVLKTNLPIHLCSVSALICCIIGFTKKNQLFFEFLFYAGIIGGILSILTPQITLYDENYFFYIMFYFKHAAIIAIPLFMRYRLNMKLTKFSWLKVFSLVNLLLLFVLPINALIDSNYLYVSRPPVVNNPLIIEDLNKVFGIPTYVFYWEIFLFILVILFYYFFRHKTIKAAK